MPNTRKRNRPKDDNKLGHRRRTLRPGRGVGRGDGVGGRCAVNAYLLAILDLSLDLIIVIWGPVRAERSVRRLIILTTSFIFLRRDGRLMWVGRLSNDSQRFSDKDPATTNL